MYSAKLKSNAYYSLLTARGVSIISRRPILAPVAALVVVAALSAFIQTYILNWGLTDNGDGFRVLRSGFMDWATQVQQGTRLPTRLPLLTGEEWNVSYLIPGSTAGLLVSAISQVSFFLGLENFYFAALSFAYFIIFYWGFALLYQQMASSLSRVLAVIALVAALCSPFYASYFYSVYEEAATLALVPLFLALIAMAAGERKARPLLVVASFLVGLSSKAALLFGVPLLALAVYRPRRGYSLSLLAFSLAQVVVFLFHFGIYANSKHANNFNRVFAGVAYSEAGVSGWEAYNFVDRLDLARSKVTSRPIAGLGLPDEATAVWGRGYWHLGREVSNETRFNLSRLGRFPNFVKEFYANLPKLIYEATLTAWKSDLSVSYLYSTDLMRSVDRRYGAPMYRGSFLVIAGLLALWAGMSAKSLVWVSTGAVVLIAPAYVAVGDGFYEFEKNLVPFAGLSFFVVPTAVSIAVASGRVLPLGRQGQRQLPPSPPDEGRSVQP